MKRVFYLIIVSVLVAYQSAFAQDDLLKELQTSVPQKSTPVIATFKGTRLINFHTVEVEGAGTLEFRIAHRFGDFSSGSTNFWGLDGPASIQLHLDYSITNRLMVGIGRTSYNKWADAFVKYKILTQTVEKGMPVTVTGLFSTNINLRQDPTKAATGVEYYQYFSSRLAYFSQVMVARKFNPKLSLQLSPMWVHYNLVQNLTDNNNMFALEASGRYKFTRSIALTAEYSYRVFKYSRDFNSYYNALGIGIDVETGGHVFQMFVTNAFGINEVEVIPYTASAWNKGNIRLGFNISRAFTVKHQK